MSFRKLRDLSKVTYFVCLVVFSGFSQTLFAQDAAFLKSIKQGGYVIFFRHAATDHSQRDIDRENLSDCSKQRNLNDAGREQARAIGEGFKQLAIPVGSVISSNYCRCLETANLAFGKVRGTIDITGIVGVTPEEFARRVKVIKNALLTLPSAGTNTVMVSHKWMFQDASGLELHEGEAAIYKPDGKGKTSFVARVRADDWKHLAK